MNNCSISFKARATGPDLHLCAYVNNTMIFSDILKENKSIIIASALDDSVAKTNTLRIVMTGKTFDHTKLDADGNIISDCVIEISDLSLDSIELGTIFHELSTYTHNYNGTAELIKQQFYGLMGCNGSVEFEFTSPVYAWLLENA